MDFSTLMLPPLNAETFTALLSIVVIDLVLAGDNAVVIAMAVRTLPPDQRKKGILLGSGAAILLRVILTFFVAQLLRISFIKLAGGLLITWIAVRLFADGLPDSDKSRQASSLWDAVRIIVIADITMALDNMLAVGGASHGNLFLLLFGLGLSIPFIVFTSNLLSMLMDRYPVIIYAGSAILGKVAGEMIVTDPALAGVVPQGSAFRYATEAAFAVAVIVAGKIFAAVREARAEKAAHIHGK